MNTDLSLIPSEIQSTASRQKLINDFLNSRDIKPASRETYHRAIKPFFNWLQEHSLQLHTLTRADIVAYKTALESSGLSGLTIGSYISVIRQFYEWTEANKYYPNIAKGIKTPRRKQRFEHEALQDSQATRLLDYYKERFLRDFAIVNLMLRTALRTIEIIRANVNDIADIQTKNQTHRVLFVQGKGEIEKNEFVGLTDPAYQPLADYLQTRGPLKTNEPLFTSVSRRNHAERLTTRTIRAIVKEGLRAIGIDGRKFSAHSLRHTTANILLEKGASLDQVQALLRHASPVTTQIYLKSRARERRLKANIESLLDTAF